MSDVVVPDPLAITCPVCNAAPGEFCLRGKSRGSAHTARVRPTPVTIARTQSAIRGAKRGNRHPNRTR
jgi:hypothetical protein